jgi:hypothetical protein
MYCYTQFSNITCALNELLLWSHISSEHPIFIKTVAELSKKNLPTNIIEKLMHVNKIFTSLQNDANKLKKDLPQGPYATNMNIKQTKLLIDRFLRNDEFVIGFLPDLKKYGEDDMVWQTLIGHIIHEQQFMYNLFTDLLSQIHQ